jgi:hypothetical protein
MRRHVWCLSLCALNRSSVECQVLRPEPQYQGHEAKARRGYSQAFEGEANEPDGKEGYNEGHHERSPAYEALRAMGRSKTFLTDMACQAPPRAVEMPRALRASARARNEVAPAF